MFHKVIAPLLIQSETFSNVVEHVRYLGSDNSNTAATGTNAEKHLKTRCPDMH